MTVHTIPSVSSQAGGSPAGISRRQAMNMMTAVAAVPALGMPSGALAFSVGDREAWNAAVARYEKLNAQVERVGKTVTALFDAAEAECPRRAEFFSRYNMGCGISRERNFSSAHMTLVVERARGRHLTSEEEKQVTADANRIVDEFDTWKSQHDAAFAEYDRRQARFDSLVDEQGAARRAMLGTPAPDGEAMLYKIEVLAAQLLEADSEDADDLAAIRADARRMLTNGRA